RRIATPGGAAAIGARVSVFAALPRRRPSSIARRVAHRQIVNLLADLVTVSVRHPRRFVDVFAHVIVITLPRHLLNDCAEDDETGVAVLEARARLEAERVVNEQREVIGDRSDAAFLLV